VRRPRAYYGPRIAALLIGGAGLGLMAGEMPIEVVACCLIAAAGALVLLL
jgi:hypothetical protein